MSEVLVIADLGGIWEAVGRHSAFGFTNVTVWLGSLVVCSQVQVCTSPGLHQVLYQLIGGQDLTPMGGTVAQPSRPATETPTMSNTVLTPAVWT